MAEHIQVGTLGMEFLQNKHDTHGSLDQFVMTVPPGGEMPVAHYHKDWDKTAYGLTGTVTFTVDGMRHRVGPGDTLFIPRGVVHGFDNDSGAEARCLCTLTPGVLGPEYFRELGALIAKGPPDEAVAKDIMLRHGLVPAA